MFKYLWIVILAIVLIGFIWYTIKCILEAYQFTHDWLSALDSVGDTHEFLYAIWVAIIFFGTATLFVISLCVYASSLE